MSLSPQWLDELRARTSLSGVIGRTTRLTKAGREFKACCPFHNEKSPSFTVNDDKGFYHCFGCGAHGDAIRWLTDQRGLAFMDAVKELADEAGLELPAMDPRAAEKAEKRQGLDEVMAAAQAWFVERLRSDEGAAARKYLAGRGFAPAVVERFGFGFAPEGRQALKAALKQFPEAMLIEGGLRIVVEEKEPYDRFRGRLMLPIRNPRGQIVGFGGRILDAAKTPKDSGAPKYLNSPDTPIFDKGRTLYNLDKAAPLARKSGRLVVVEGYMDVVALANAGIGEAVAPLGTALTEAQLELAWRVCETPVLCFDGDAAGQRAAMRAMIRALPLLRPSHSLAICRMPQGLDPDDLLKAQGPQALLDLLGKATPMVEALWLAERDAAPLPTPEAKAGLKARLIAHVETITDNDIRSLYRRELLKRFSAFAFPPRDWSAHKNIVEISEARRWAATQTRGFRSVLPGPASAELKATNFSASARDKHLHRRLGAALAAGLAKYPNYSMVYAETLLTVPDLDPRLEAIAEATYEYDILDSEQISAIFARKGLKMPVSADWDHIRFPFLWPPVDDLSAARGLENAIRHYVGWPQVQAALMNSTNHLAVEASDDNWQEQQRLRRAVSDFLNERRESNTTH